MWLFHVSFTVFYVEMDSDSCFSLAHFFVLGFAGIELAHKLMASMGSCRLDVLSLSTVHVFIVSSSGLFKLQERLGGRHTLEWVARRHHETHGCYLSDRSFAGHHGTTQCGRISLSKESNHVLETGTIDTLKCGAHGE